jgi:aryl carrier-like protein
LYIGGDGLAQGYWNRPELTAEKFVLDTFRPGPGRRLYKTGDLVRPHPDGTFEFLGRMDNQVKIRGFRIETGDVEHALKQHPAVRDCIVVAREDVPGDRQLVAYIVAADPLPPGELRRHLAGMLPGYMVPSAFVALDALPQTPNGKVDRRALPTPIRPSGATAEAAVPRTPQEETLAAICAAVLRQPTVSVDANLFDLGVDSLRLFQIAARAKDSGLTVTVKQILARQTVAAVCAELSAPVPETSGPILTAVNRERYRLQRQLGGSNPGENGP